MFKKLFLLTTLIAIFLNFYFSNIQTATAATVNGEEELAYNIGIQAIIYGYGATTIAKIRESNTSVDAPSDNATAPLGQLGKHFVY